MRHSSLVKVGLELFDQERRQELLDGPECLIDIRALLINCIGAAAQAERRQLLGGD